MEPLASESETKTFSVEQLADFIRRVLRHFELSDEDAAQSADGFDCERCSWYRLTREGFK